MAKIIPPHVVAQRARGPNKPLRSKKERSEKHDVFQRIDMHGGAKDVCWEWNGAHGLGKRGEYRARVRINNKDGYVHRIVYELYTGYTLLPHDVIRHQCDNSWCCNPYHMLIGTQADNVADMMERERVGMKHFQVKRIMQMLEDGCNAVHVKQKMQEGYNINVGVTVIRKIKMRTLYKHIPWPAGDEWATYRRAKLDKMRAERLASDPTCGIIVDTSNKGSTTDDKA